MSSILKALRKLEDEYPRRTGGDSSLPQTPGVKKTLRRWEINSGRFAPVLWGALAFVVLAAAGWFLFYMRSPQESPAPSAQLANVPQRPVETQKQQTGSVSEPVKAAQSAKGRIPADSRRRRTAQTAVKARPFPAVGTRTPKIEKQRQPSPPLPVNPVDRSKGAGLPLLQSGLELQAVSWTPDPANRIAVINGSILREGGSIEGYSVVRIEEDEVVVRKGLSQWKLVFNLKK